MTRKGKQPGAHLPPTHYERRTKFRSSSAEQFHGTQTARLGGDSQRKFGHCCLGLSPAVDPVVTPR